VTLLQILVVLAVVAGVGAVAAGVVRGGLPEVESSVPQAPLPEGPLTADDVSAVRFSVGLRGYRMAEVDAVLDRLSEALAERDAEIERLRNV
jgi:DivIVA domain-containing protein